MDVGGPAVTTGVTVLTVGGTAGCGVTDGTDVGDTGWIVGMLVGCDGGVAWGGLALGG